MSHRTVYQVRRDARKEEAMGDRELLTGIMADTRVAVEKPPIRGTRPIVGNILNLMVHGAIMEEILGEYDGLTQEDLGTRLLFASRFGDGVGALPG
jgi:uncharacterized protein (DUF433 family)